MYCLYGTAVISFAMSCNRRMLAASAVIGFPSSFAIACSRLIVSASIVVLFSLSVFLSAINRVNASYISTSGIFSTRQPSQDFVRTVISFSVFIRICHSNPRAKTRQAPKPYDFGAWQWSELYQVVKKNTTEYYAWLPSTGRKRFFTRLLKKSLSTTPSFFISSCMTSCQSSSVFGQFQPRRRSPQK